MEVRTKLLKADSSIVIRVDPIHQPLRPLLVELRERGVDFFDREKPIVVLVRGLLEELPPLGLLRLAYQPFLGPSAIDAHVEVTEEAVEPLVAVVGVGKHLPTRPTVPSSLPAIRF